MTEQNINPQLLPKSCLALSAALDIFLDTLEGTFDLTEDEATWLLANILDVQPQLMESNPQLKIYFASMAQQVKERCNQPTHNDQN